MRIYVMHAIIKLFPTYQGFITNTERDDIMKTSKILSHTVTIILILCMTSCNGILNVPFDTEADSPSEEVTETDVWSGGHNNNYLNYTMSLDEYNEFIANVYLPYYVPTYNELSYFGELSEVNILGPLENNVSSVGELIDKINTLKGNSSIYDFYGFEITYKFVGYEEMFHLRYTLYRHEGEIPKSIYYTCDDLEEIDIFKIDMEKYYDLIKDGRHGLLQEPFEHFYLENGYLEQLQFYGTVKPEDNGDDIDGYYKCEIIFLYDRTQENGKMPAKYDIKYDMSNKELNYFLNINTIELAKLKMDRSNYYGVEYASKLTDQHLENFYSFDKRVV